MCEAHTNIDTAEKTTVLDTALNSILSIDFERYFIYHYVLCSSFYENILGFGIFTHPFATMAIMYCMLC